MQIQIIKLLIYCCIPVFLIQCATKQDVQNIDFRIRYMDNKLVDLNNALDKLEKRNDLAKKKSVEIVQKRQATTGETVERLQADILQVMSNIDEVNHNLKLYMDDTKLSQEGLEEQIGELNETLQALSAQVEGLAGELNEIKIARAQEASDRAMAAAKAADQAKQKASGIRQITPRKQKIAKRDGSNDTEKASSPSEPGSDMYSQAYAFFKAKDYKEAFRAFSKYVETYPKSSKLPNARYWLADSLYNQKEYELAILEYQKVIDSFPKHPKAAAALLKEGYAFEKLKDQITAKIVYEKLLAEYPGSDQASKAKKRLGELK